MKPNGRVVCTTHRNALGMMERIDYAWHGGDIIAISGDVFDYTFERIPRPGERFTIGPFTLRCIEDRFYADEIIASREHPALSYLRYVWYRSTRVIDIAYRRTIVTLAVWKLAEYSDMRIPTWRDVYALRWLVPYVDRKAARKLRRAVDRINKGLR